MARPKLDENKKRTKVNLHLSFEERCILEEKKKKYGYQNLSAYMRDAGIHEKLFIEELLGKDEILSEVDTLINYVKECTRKQQKIMFRAELSKADIAMIKIQNEEITKKIDSLIKKVVKSLRTQIRYVSSDELEQGKADDETNQEGEE